MAPRKANKKYEVRRIIGKKGSGAKLEYRVVWDTNETTWEPAENLRSCQDAVKKFEDSQKKKKSQEDEYEVSEITGKRMKSGKPQYEVKWSTGEKSWEPAKNLSCPSLLKKFENSQNKKKEKELEYEVSAITDKQKRNGKDFYKVQWSSGEISWEPANNLKCGRLLAEYEARAKSAPKRRAEDSKMLRGGKKPRVQREDRAGDEEGPRVTPVPPAQPEQIEQEAQEAQVAAVEHVQLVAVPQERIPEPRDVAEDPAEPRDVAEDPAERDQEDPAEREAHQNEVDAEEPVRPEAREIQDGLLNETEDQENPAEEAMEEQAALNLQDGEQEREAPQIDVENDEGAEPEAQEVQYKQKALPDTENQAQQGAEAMGGQAAHNLQNEQNQEQEAPVNDGKVGEPMRAEAQELHDVQGLNRQEEPINEAVRPETQEVQNGQEGHPDAEGQKERRAMAMGGQAAQASAQEEQEAPENDGEDGQPEDIEEGQNRQDGEAFGQAALEIQNEEQRQQQEEVPAAENPEDHDDVQQEEIVELNPQNEEEREGELRQNEREVVRPETPEIVQQEDEQLANGGDGQEPQNGAEDDEVEGEDEYEVIEFEDPEDPIPGNAVGQAPPQRVIPNQEARAPIEAPLPPLPPRYIEKIVHITKERDTLVLTCLMSDGTHYFASENDVHERAPVLLHNFYRELAIDAIQIREAQTNQE